MFTLAPAIYNLAWLKSCGGFFSDEVDQNRKCQTFRISIGQTQAVALEKKYWCVLSPSLHFFLQYILTYF